MAGSTSITSGPDDEAKVEQQSGLPTPEFLARWAGTDGRASALPIGLAVFDIVGLDDTASQHSRRTRYHAARQTAAALTEPLGPVDAAVRLSTREFALVVPGASSSHCCATRPRSRGRPRSRCSRASATSTSRRCCLP